MRVRLREKVVESRHAANHARQRGRHGDIGGIRDVRFAIHLNRAHLGVKGRFDLAGCSGKRDDAIALRNAVHREALVLQPRSDFGDIRGRRAECLAELLGSQPLVKIRRGLILLLIHQRLECRYLRIA